MGRPKIPLISRDAALDAALRILDTEGPEALSIRRLGKELNVNGASLYHHFANKDEILARAAELALDRMPIKVRPDSHGEWRYWLLDGARQLRDVLTAHPALLSVIVRLRPLGVRAEMLEHMALRMIDLGVPPELVIPILDALERYVIGSVTRDLGMGDSIAEQTYLKKSSPTLHELSRNKSTRSPQETFDAVVLGIIAAILASEPARQRI